MKTLLGRLEVLYHTLCDASIQYGMFVGQIDGKVTTPEIDDQLQKHGEEMRAILGEITEVTRALESRRSTIDVAANLALTQTANIAGMWVTDDPAILKTRTHVLDIRFAANQIIDLVK